MKTAYYNEIDPYAAAWLRNLISGGHIAPGDVDERSIEDVRPDDLRGYTQCHFFAGVAGWSLALRLAGVDDSTRLWTGSCPCQPFSAAGKGAGFADERHLWPAFFHLIRERRPAIVVGEQVASNLAWLDLVSGDLEGEGYAVGSAIVGAHSVGAPHTRQRLYWVAAGSGNGMAHDNAPGRSLERRGGLLDGERPALGDDADGCGADDWLADGAGARSAARLPEPQAGQEGLAGVADDGGGERAGLAGRPTSGFWRDVRWLNCADGRTRPAPVEPGLFPLAHGVSSGMGRVRADQEPEAEIPRAAQGSRVGRLRAYGNAITVQVAVAFLKATL